jgi:hypothetical protein
MNYSYEECKKYIIKGGNHNELLNYVKFDFNDYNYTDYIRSNFFIKLLKNCKDENVLKHVIDNVIELECENNDKKYRPIHIICILSTPEMIKYIIDKGVNLECDDK